MVTIVGSQVKGESSGTKRSTFYQSTADKMSVGRSNRKGRRASWRKKEGFRLEAGLKGNKTVNVSNNFQSDT